jgi:hypothetical protein
MHGVGCSRTGFEHQTAIAVLEILRATQQENEKEGRQDNQDPKVRSDGLGKALASMSLAACPRL